MTRSMHALVIGSMVLGVAAMAPPALGAIKGDGIIDPGEEEIAELARAVQNPLASLISLPIQNNTTIEFGPQEDPLNVLNVQPVWPLTGT